MLKHVLRIFYYISRELKKEGFLSGQERFEEFCNILFLKLFISKEELKYDEQDLLKNMNLATKYLQNKYGKDVFKPLKILDPLILKNIFSKIDALNLDYSATSSIIEYFSYLAGRQKDLGEFYTPMHINDMIVKILKPKEGETVYDPFCGVAGMLISVYNYMPKAFIYGNEISRISRIAKMNLLLLGVDHKNINKTNSLKNPSTKKYDIVITNIPFGTGYFKEYEDIYDLKTSDGNELSILHCFDSLDIKLTSRMAIIVPDTILLGSKYQKIREYIYNNSFVESIVSLPTSVFKPYTDVKTSILFLRTKTKRQEHIWYFNIKNDGYTQNSQRIKIDGQNDIDVLLENYTGQDLQGVTLLEYQDIKNNQYISIPQKTNALKLNSRYKIAPLKEFIEEISITDKKEEDIATLTANNGLIPRNEFFISPLSSTRDGYKLVPINAFVYNPMLKKTCVTITLNQKRQVRVSSRYVTFKVKDEAILDTSYLHYVLKTKVVYEQMKNNTNQNVRQEFRFNGYKNIFIPIPPIDVQKALVKNLDQKQKCVDIQKEAISLLQDEILTNIKTIWE